MINDGPRDVLQQRKRELPIWLRVLNLFSSRIIYARGRRAIDGVVAEGPGLLALHHICTDTGISDAAEEAPLLKRWLIISHFVELVVDPTTLKGLLVAYCLSFFRLYRFKDTLSS